MCHLKIKHIEVYLSFYEWPQKWSKYRYLRHFIVSPSVIVLFYFAVVILSISSLMACWVECLARNPYWCLYSLLQNLVRCDINLSYIKCSTIFEKHSRTVIGLYFWKLSFPFDWRIGVMIEIFIWLIGMIPAHAGKRIVTPPAPSRLPRTCVFSSRSARDWNWGGFVCGQLDSS